MAIYALGLGKCHHYHHNYANTKTGLVGDWRQDVALWFMIAVIMAAWLPGAVSHWDILHAYMIVLLWVCMHHHCRAATAWGSSYIASLLMPSLAMMPLEFCLPLRDTGDDFESVKQWRDFIKSRTGVELEIEC